MSLDSVRKMKLFAVIVCICTSVSSTLFYAGMIMLDRGEGFKDALLLSILLNMIIIPFCLKAYRDVKSGRA